MYRRTGHVVLAFVVICSSGLAARQPDTTASLRVRVESARQQLESDPASAVEALDEMATESVELRKTRVLTDAERSLHRDVFLLRARGHLLLLNNEKVEDSFRELLRVDPLFSTQLTPREQEVLDGIRRREAGFLEVSSPERDATIFVDGLSVGVTGETPGRVTLLAGDYEVRLEKEGFQSAVVRATVTSGAVTSIGDLAPQRRVPPVLFITDRDDIEIVADSVPIGRTVKLATIRSPLSPAESAALDRATATSGFDQNAAGALLMRQPPIDRPILVRFRRDCFVEETRTITIRADALEPFGQSEALLWFGDASAVRMQTDIGTLRITSTPSDADVFIDGRLAGRTPFERSYCSGQHHVRVRHRIGSYSATATVTRGRTEVFDAPLKASLAFLGAVDTTQGSPRPAPDLTSTLDSAIASAVTTYKLATRLDLPPEMQRWSDTSTAELVNASDRNDGGGVMRLLKLAGENYDAPLFFCAVRRPAGNDPQPPVDLLIFWIEHEGVDRVRWNPAVQPDPGPILARLDAPPDASDFVYQNTLGIRIADTSLPETPLLIVQVDAGSPAAAAGLKVGDSIEAIDGTGVNASQLADRVRQKRPGDLVTLRVASIGTPARQASVPVLRKPRRAPVFDPSLFGNAVMAKLTVASILAANTSDRALLDFNLALARMRFSEWRAALELLERLSNTPAGTGVGPGAVMFFRARCHEQLGERDKAIALYREASVIDDQMLAEDGASVAALAKRRLVALKVVPASAPTRKPAPARH